MTDYDVYYQWLGIPPAEQPPTHYRLLGLREFEDHEEVIRNAADRQINYVRQLARNEFTQVGQELLNELAAAKICLLNPEKRRRYDESLAAAAATPAPPAARSWIIGSLDSCDIVVAAATVSGSHCKLTRQGEQLTLTDLGSTNGTYVNRRRIRDPHQLSPADLITLGRDVRFRLPQEARPEAFQQCHVVYVGRSAANDIQIDSPFISAVHARFVFQPTGDYVEDLGSTNGILLQSPRGQIHLVRQQASLEGIDSVKLGSTILPVRQVAAEQTR